MSTENTDVVPQSLHSFYNDDGTVLGYLAIDSDVNGVSGGGIRMVPEMPAGDLCHLARAMTLKYGFLKWPFGGAKAMILTHRDTLSLEQRQRCVRSFAEQLRPFVGRYLPGEDAGTNDDDLRLICKTAGLMRQKSIPDSGYFTAWTVRVCTEQVAALQQRSLDGARAAIEGFGKVGGALAGQLSDLGCRIVAVSTARGAVYDPNGLAVDRLLRARETAGDDCVNKYQGGERIDTTRLLTVPADFLIPCALSWSIDTSNAGDIQASAVICGANNPVTEKARGILSDRGILYFPDFVANSGGVLGSIVGSLGVERTRTIELMNQIFKPKVEELMAQARTTERPLEETARRIAMDNHKAMKQAAEQHPNGLFSGIIRIARRGLMPAPLKRVLGPMYVKKTMS